MCTENEQHKSNHYIGEDGHIHVKNLSAYWLPDITLQKEIGGTIYTISGSYEGIETLDKKLVRILLNQWENGKHDI